MPLTPGTLLRHELIGLRTEVVDAANPDLVGRRGRVVDETQQTLLVEGDDSRVRRVPKRGTKFQFTIPTRTDETAVGRKTPGSTPERTDTAGPDSGGDAAREDVVYVTVDGARLLSRPALRTENVGVRTWR